MVEPLQTETSSERRLLAQLVLTPMRRSTIEELDLISDVQNPEVGLPELQPKPHWSSVRRLVGDLPGDHAGLLQSCIDNRSERLPNAPRSTALRSSSILNSESHSSPAMERSLRLG